MKEKKFKVLRLLGTLYKIVGVLIAIFTILGAVIAVVIGVFGADVLGQWSQMAPMMGPRPDGPGMYPGMWGMNAFGGVISAVMLLLWGLLLSAMLYGAGELFYLYIAVEENTRVTARLLQNKPIE